MMIVHRIADLRPVEDEVPVLHKLPAGILAAASHQPFIGRGRVERAKITIVTVQHFVSAGRARQNGEDNGYA